MRATRDGGRWPISRLIGPTAVGFGVFIIGVIVAANTGFRPPVGAFVLSVPFGDKVGHAVLFGLLALLTNLALRCRSVAVGPLSVLLASALVTAFVIVEELSQAFLPTRSLDATDLLADLVGITVATTAAPRLQRAMTGPAASGNHAGSSAS